MLAQQFVRSTKPALARAARSRYLTQAAAQPEEVLKSESSLSLPID